MNKWTDLLEGGELVPQDCSLKQYYKYQYNLHLCEYCPEEAQPVIAKHIIKYTVIDPVTKQERFSTMTYVCPQHKVTARRDIESASRWLKEEEEK